MNKNNHKQIKWNSNMLREYRKNSGLTLKELAFRVDIPEKTLHRLESTESDFKEEYQEKLSKAVIYELTLAAMTLFKSKPNKLSLEIDENKVKYNDEVLLKLQKTGGIEHQKEKIEFEFESYFSKFIKSIPSEIKINICSLYLFIKDKKVSLPKKSIAIGALIYFVSPIDAIPDMTPVVGFLDDFGVIATAVAYYAIELKPYKDEAEKYLKSKKWM